MPEPVNPHRPPLVGRDEALEQALEYARDAVGCIAIVGERLSGRTRFAVEVLDRLPEIGYRSVIYAELGSDDPVERLQNATAGAQAPFAVFLGHVVDHDALGGIARHLDALG